MARHTPYYDFDGQNNLQTVNTYVMGIPAPIVADRIWDTRANALSYIADANGSAFPGMRLTVIKDSTADNNGLYYVKPTINGSGNPVRPYSLVKLTNDINALSLITANSASSVTEITTNQADPYVNLTKKATYDASTYTIVDSIHFSGQKDGSNNDVIKVVGNAGSVAINFPTVSPHYVLAGPSTGSSSAVPSFRQLKIEEIDELDSFGSTTGYLRRIATGTAPSITYSWELGTPIDRKTDQTLITDPTQDANNRPLLIAKGTTASTSINDETLFAKNLYYTPKADTLYVGNVETTGNITATGNISGTNITASGDISGANITASSKFSGIAEIKANQYFSSNKYGIDMQNSDIIHANSIFCNDTSEKGEGLHFFRSNNTYDSLRIDNSGLVKFDKGWSYSSGTVTGGTTYDVAISGSQTASGITVQTAGTTSDKYYPVQTNPDTGMAVVNVPWSGGSDTWRNVKVNNTQILGTGTNTSALNFVNGTGINISGNSNGNVTISATGGVGYTDIWNDCYVGQNVGTIGSESGYGFSLNRIDAPFYCTDLRYPSKHPTYGGTDKAFQYLGWQWRIHEVKTMPDHLTIWPYGLHTINKSILNYYFDNWAACMATSWIAGWPMSVSVIDYIKGDWIRKWIPLVYSGTLDIPIIQNGEPTGSTVKESVSIDLGYAMVINLAAHSLLPNYAWTNYQLSDRWYGAYTLSNTPITFRYFDGLTFPANYHPNTGGNLTNFYQYLETKPISGGFPGYSTEIIDIWNQNPGDDGSGEGGAYNIDPSDEYASNRFYLTAYEVSLLIKSRKGVGAEGGMYVCTSLPHISATTSLF